jgi:hypothetical protein
MSSIINQAVQYIEEHAFEVTSSFITVTGVGLFLAWWKSAEDNDLEQDQDEEPNSESKPSQPVSTEKPAPKPAKVVRPPPSVLNNNV